MCIHRCTPPVSIEIVDIAQPFSSFDYVEDQFAGHNGLRRIFSIARSQNANTMIVETIPAAGIIDDENSEIAGLFPDYAMTALKRLSFWTGSGVSIDTLGANPEGSRGYVILKRDNVPSKPDYHCWHIFESVFRKYDHHHNCVPNAGTYSVGVGEHVFGIPGVMYCQQNGLNKACAHVALRSLLTRFDAAPGVPYRIINDIARLSGAPEWLPECGLSVKQIRAVLDHFEVGYSDVVYDADDSLRITHPYQKFAYAGVESGAGALVGFKLAGSGLQEEQRHIIPFYGHTFNKDTWAPDAEIDYFHIGESLRYIPSESWTSSFLGHDDNFGSNFCIPRLYIERDNVEYVVELFRPGVKYSGVEAEAYAISLLYSIIPLIDLSLSRWLDRLAYWTGHQRVVLRAVPVSSDEYIAHLSELKDWDGHEEDSEYVNELKDELPAMLWMIELSTPHLFPANERKLGEIVLDAGKDSVSADELGLFVFARFPGCYIFGNDINEQGTPSFLQIATGLLSYTPLKI